MIFLNSSNKFGSRLRNFYEFQPKNEPLVYLDQNNRYLLHKYKGIDQKSANVLNSHQNFKDDINDKIERFKARPTVQLLNKSYNGVTDFMTNHPYLTIGAGSLAAGLCGLTYNYLKENEILKLNKINKIIENTIIENTIEEALEAAKVIAKPIIDNLQDKSNENKLSPAQLNQLIQAQQAQQAQTVNQNKNNAQIHKGVNNESVPKQ